LGFVKLTVQFEVPDSLFETLIRNLVEKRGQLTMAGAADLVHLSPTRFSSEIRRLTGYNFRLIRVFVKLKIGARMLLETDLRISEIAYYLGYSEPRKFNRVFRQHLRMSPSAYRAAFANAEIKDFASRRTRALATIESELNVTTLYGKAS
jgi:AraC-like DNA-binding protein